MGIVDTMHTLMDGWMEPSLSLSLSHTHTHTHTGNRNQGRQGNPIGENKISQG